jgi:hypothetical protein
MVLEGSLYLNLFVGDLGQVIFYLHFRFIYLEFGELGIKQKVVQLYIKSKGSQFKMENKVARLKL